MTEKTRRKSRIIKGRNFWLEEIDGDWFVCVNRKIHGVKTTVRVSVAETMRKIKEVE